MISSIFLVLFYLTNLSFCDERSPRVKRIVGGIPAAEPPSDDPTIFTNFAGRSARVQGVIDYPHYVFRGIKYAYPPTGKNRFLRPREKLLDGLINATYYAPPCIQPRPGTDQVIGSEDCLALNVFTPELPTGTEGIPAGVIAMSGTAVSSWAVDNTPQHTAYNIAKQNGCPIADPLTMVKCLQTLPPESIIRNLRKLIPLKLQINLKEIKAKFEENFQKGIENLENIIGKLVPPNFSNYVKLKTGKLVEALDKVADVTNDALFNVPAFLTADTWSIHGAPTYLYSFDHFGKNKKGHTFLKGSPLVGNDTHFVELNDTVSHGDDLAYLFDAYDVEGNPLEHDNLTADDIKVREIFTQMIADFARYGVPKVNDKPASPFDAKKNNFIKITSSPSLSNNFKFCEMALWCNIAERLKSTTCDFLKALDTSFKNMQNFVNGLKNANLSPEKIVEHINMLKNLTGQGINIFNQTGLANLSPDKVFKEINEKIKNVSLGVHSLLPPHEHNGFDILKIFDKKDQKDPKQNGFNLIPNIFEKKDPNQNGFHLLPNIFEKKQESKPQSVITGGFLNLFDVKQDSMPKPQQSTPFQCQIYYPISRSKHLLPAIRHKVSIF
ncbi:unnamed protein product [Diabrotica balteata]|uniref:Carboxylesterase type B domain-containing protein n=1 Tax=Diabrotica balteata TaxID=107213 RepID=A0A9N9SR61_DIABA|nr:unnamed protein product [Diabrotica balteata]